jgi:molybdopterin-containing oxidoreductase family iron-sulfur binding subunit
MKFDPAEARAGLGRVSGRKYWRSLEELAGSAEFQSWLRREQPALAELLDMDRRGFLKILGASLALAGVGACSHPPQTSLVPYVHAPLGQTAGLPRFFASILTRCGFAQGVLVESHMGRPTKIEGNPQHPASLGATDVFGQAAVLQLWDPDRSRSVMHAGVNASWEQVDAVLADLRTRCGRDGGAGLRILTGAVTSPTLLAQLDAVQTQYPHAHWHVHQPGYSDHAAEGARLAFGTPLAARLRLERAAVILSLDGDFLSDPAAGVRYARDFAAGRSPESGTMNRLYVVESTPSLAGAMADHCLPADSASMQRFLLSLAARLGVQAGHIEEEAQTRWLDAVAADLQSHRGASLIVVGSTQPAWMHAVAAVLNSRLGNIGATVEYTEPVQRPVAEDASLPALVTAMQSGSVDTLLLLDVNPAYDAPSDLQFSAALKRIPHALHLGLYYDETASLAEWHLPLAHALEAWSDARAFDGTASLAQPLIAPLYGGRSAHEILAALLADQVLLGQDIVRRQWRTRLSDDGAWESALRRGLVDGTALPARTATLKDDWQSSLPAALPATVAGLEVIFRPDPTIGDGRWANNAWLQELPKPLTQLTWENALLISPQLAAQQALDNGDIVALQLEAGSISAPVWIMPGQAPQSVTLHLGYGRTHAGHVGNGQGINAYAVRRSSALWVEHGVALRKTGRHVALAGTQHHFQMEAREPVKVATLAEYRQHPDYAHQAERWPDKPPSLYADQAAGDYAWGMSIDLNSCIGCKVCTIACQAENNIPVVGADQVRRGREMHWLRVDRYYEGPAENPHSYSQPVPCMMCEHAPCEVVCPVEATVHDSEGLNLQVYNRCVGTRFCSNNCPYKVRRFNFLEYVDPAETLKAQRNPEVSVRRRGVMEKCTYCIQRIETAHIEADKAGRRLHDGEIVTACQAACPTQVIRFGDTRDAASSVARAKALARNYTLLPELGTRPRTSYLARVRNPNAALEED